uniref:Uncharacterized protein n=2 Tax=Avena sativa TaxID=4498 RepID=A0ACD5YFT3_AVESA
MGFGASPRNNTTSSFSNFSSFPIVFSPVYHLSRLTPSASLPFPEHAGDRLRRAGSPATKPATELRCVMNKGGIHNRETHGTSGDISEGTSVEKVKAPNLLGRAKEEIEALAAAIHDKMEHHSSPRRKEGGLHKDSKGGIDATTTHKKTHETETHGTSNDISEDTPVNKVKGPNVFERAKEEIEAVVEAIHPKKGSDK